MKLNNAQIERIKRFAYPVKCPLGLCVFYWLYRRFPQHQFYWSLISALLVFAPEDKDSNKLAFDRMTANALGSSVGLILYLIHPPGLFLMCVGLVATLALSAVFKLDTATRSAIAALVIVSIHEQQNGTWRVAAERVGSVLLGCGFALVVTLLFNRLFRWLQADAPAAGI